MQSLRSSQATEAGRRQLGTVHMGRSAWVAERNWGFQSVMTEGFITVLGEREGL
jgi:hypothetical protein